MGGGGERERKAGPRRRSGAQAQCGCHGVGWRNAGEMSREEMGRQTPMQDDEEDEEIDQFNEDTFGSGAVEDWEEQGGESDDLLKERHLAQTLSLLVVEDEGTDVPTQPSQTNSSLWDGPVMFQGMRNPVLTHLGDRSTFPGCLDPSGRSVPASDLGKDLSDRAPPPRSSSPVIGSPPVRTAPIGTPPKSTTLLQIQPAAPQRLRPSFNDGKSSIQPLHMLNSSLHSPQGIQAGLPQMLTPLLLGGAQAGCHSPSPLVRVSGLLGGAITAGQCQRPLPAGFRSFLPSMWPSHPSLRGDTANLHPQHKHLLTQREQGARSLHHTQNDFSRMWPMGETSRVVKDPYSDLMSQREKEWVSKIQMMQLQTANPVLDDYYYQNYFQRLQLRNLKHISSETSRRGKTRLITPQLVRHDQSYRPVQFEGSLGKLTISSVNNPRKMIDAVVTPRAEDDESKDQLVRDRRRQTLHNIEKTYTLLLEVLDLEQTLRLGAGEETVKIDQARKAKIDQIYRNLRGRQLLGSERPSDDEFLQVMSIRKGKRLVARTLSLLGTEEATQFLLATARHLPLLSKKDAQDEVLPCFEDPFVRLLTQVTPRTLTQVLNQLVGGRGENLAAVVQSKFGLTLFHAILNQGERLEVESGSQQDSEWTDLVVTVTQQLLRSADMSPSEVPALVSQRREGP